MATNPSAVSNIATVVSAAAAGATSGPASLISAIAELAKPLIDLIPDPQKKLEAQQHVADQQFALAQAQIAQQDTIIQATSSNVKSDPHMSGQRAYFCGGITSMLLFNYAMTPLLHALLRIDIAPLPIPASVLSIFAVIMLGFVGIPSALDMVQAVAGMPGESQVSVLGVKVGNKS